MSAMLDPRIVAASVSCNNPCTTATLTPSSALANNTQYTATISTAAKAADGTALANNYSWTFTTGT